MTRLDRVIKFVDRKLLRGFYDRWVKGTSRICDLENALVLNNKTCLKNKLRRNFYKWRGQAKAIKRGQNVTDRSQWMQQMKKKSILKDAFYELQLYTRQNQVAKKLLKRAILGVGRNFMHDAFTKWKSANANHVQEMHMEEIGELQNRQEEEKMEIKRIQKQIEEDQSSKTRIESKMKSLSQKVMANFITRMISMNMSKGFYTWLDEVKAHNRRRRALTSAINHLTRLSVDFAFQKWAKRSYHIK